MPEHRRLTVHDIKKEQMRYEQQMRNRFRICYQCCQNPQLKEACIELIAKHQFRYMELKNLSQ